MKRYSFARILGIAFVVAVAAGVAVYVLTGATTNRGTTGAIAAENAEVLSAEKARCTKDGTYASLATLLREGFLVTQPTYNSVVYVPGKGCGTIVVGSAAYQPGAG